MPMAISYLILNSFLVVGVSRNVMFMKTPFLAFLLNHILFLTSHLHATTFFVECFNLPRSIFRSKQHNNHFSIGKTSHDTFNEPETAFSSQDSTGDSVIGPPEKLRALTKLGQLIYPLPETPIAVKRIAFQPDIYLVTNLLPFDIDRKALMNQDFSSEMEEATTKSGMVAHRSKCFVTSISCHEEDSIEDELCNSHGKYVADFMEQLQTCLFLSPFSFHFEKIRAEPMQVVRYDPGGKYDFHHDGFNRILTVITYLNGVAGTWFPYARIVSSTPSSDEENPPEMKLEGEGMATDKIPGRDGVLVIGELDKCCNMNDYDDDNPHVVKIKPGDAIAFYNYQWTSAKEEEGQKTLHRNHNCSTICTNKDSLMINWRSIHSALPASQEKWIATNWFAYDDAD